MDKSLYLIILQIKRRFKYMEQLLMINQLLKLMLKKLLYNNIFQSIKKIKFKKPTMDFSLLSIFGMT